MEGTKINCFFIFFFAFAAMVPTLMANIAHFDEVWQKRAQEARQSVLESYVPNPDNVTHHLNLHVHKAVQEFGPANITRRFLRGKQYKGPCIAANPIDRCWRCNPNWHNNRKRLADCALGFGQRTVGGKFGRYYLVTDNSDKDLINPRPGTLRHAVIQKEPLWIIFSKSMTIRLKAELIMQGDKTIDGRGYKIHIAYGAGIMIQFVRNVIIHGLHMHDIIETGGGTIRDSVDHVGFRTPSEGDAITVFGSSNVWIDHISMWRCKDGLIDVVAASTAVTISNSHFTDHNDVMLFGAHDINSADKIMQVTVAFNHFGKRLIQRMPRCRWGFIHIINNDYTHWLMYAIGGSSQPTIISQGNRFIAPPNQAAKEVTKRDYAPKSVWRTWTWRSDGDLMMNGAFFRQSGKRNGASALGRLDRMIAAPGRAAPALTRFAGSLGCKPGKPC